jgi:hypothetical protein
MRRILPAAAIMLCLTGRVAGVELGTYVLVSTGLKGGTVSPPGLYPLSLNFFYHASSIRDRNGDEISHIQGLDFRGEADAYLNITGVTYITDLKFMGANYGARLINTSGVLELDTRIGPNKIRQHKAGNVDLYLEPINLSWHLPRFDIFTSYGFYAPVGEFNDDDPVSATDRWSHLFSAGMTAWLDKEKRWGLAIVPRYEIYHRNIHRDVTAGHDALFEWGISRNFRFTCANEKQPWASLDIGPVGYATWKVTQDKGPGASNERYSAYAAGLEASLTMVKWHNARFSLRAEKEFLNHSRPQGQMAMFTFAVKF